MRADTVSARVPPEDQDGVRAALGRVRAMWQRADGALQARQSGGEHEGEDDGGAPQVAQGEEDD